MGFYVLYTLDSSESVQQTQWTVCKSKASACFVMAKGMQQRACSRWQGQVSKHSSKQSFRLTEVQ